MKTLKISDEQYNFFNNLLDLMTDQDYRHTQRPLYYIYQKDRIYRIDDGDGYVYVDTMGDYRETDEYTTKEDAVYKLDSDQDLWIFDRMEDEYAEIPEDLEKEIDGWDFVHKDGVTLERVAYQDITKPVLNCGPFLTEKAANAHITANHYHYDSPHTYVDGMWRNPELIETIQKLFEIFGKEVPSHYK